MLTQLALPVVSPVLAKALARKMLQQTWHAKCYSKKRALHSKPRAKRTGGRAWHAVCCAAHASCCSILRVKFAVAFCVPRLLPQLVTRQVALTVLTCTSSSTDKARCVCI